MARQSDAKHVTLEINGGSQDTNAKKSTEKKMQRQALLQDEIEKLKNRVRAFTGAFVVMISPVLLAIVLKKVNLTGAGKYQGRIRALGAFIDLLQRRFAHLAAVTLQMGIMPFLCVMISEACASRPPLSYVAPRLVAASKVLVFLSNFLLMALGCGILLLFHKNALLVLTFCSVMAVGVVAVHIWYLCCCVVDDAGDDATQGDAEAEYHSKLEHLLELSAGKTVMMFLVLEFVALEGLLRNTRQVQAPGPVKGQETFLGAALLISFVASALGVSLMNVWTTPHVISGCVVLTAEFMRGLNFVMQALPITAVVVLITLDVLPHPWKLAVFLPLFPPVIVLLVLLVRYSREVMKRQGPAAGSTSSSSSAGQQGSATGSSTSSDSSSDEKKPKPASLELTKVAFTGFLAVAVPSVTSASVCVPSIFFVLFSAATVILGLLWRLLTHEAEPPSYVLKAANHASFSAHMSIFLAGIAFWVMAALAVH
ncbi:uncharacterized protein [Miscanthus floridulus]|uniref:uncharacterized protein n=1 Tax=Miscanthus floridulus TaxID=154761 RepID=UPI00345A847C